MKLCQRCADGISEAAGVLQSARVQTNVVECYFAAEGGDTASGQLALGDYALVPEPDCEFWAHAKLMRVLSEVLDLSREQRDHMARVAEALK